MAIYVSPSDLVALIDAARSEVIQKQIINIQEEINELQEEINELQENIGKLSSDTKQISDAIPENGCDY